MSLATVRTALSGAMARRGLDVGPARQPDRPRLGAADAEGLAQVLRSWQSEGERLAAG